MIRRILAGLALFTLLGTAPAHAGVTVGQWVATTYNPGTPYTDSAVFVIDSVVYYAVEASASGTDLRIGKGVSCNLPGFTDPADDSLRYHYKILVPYDATRFPGAYGLGLYATFYSRVRGTTTKFMQPGDLTYGTHVIAADSTWRVMDIADSPARKIANILSNGTVASSLSGASTTRIPVTPAVFTQANDFFNDQTLRFYTGALAGQVTRITDFVSNGTADTFLVMQTTGTAASGDSFVVIGDWAEAPSVATVDFDAATGTLSAAQFEAGFYQAVEDTMDNTHGSGDWGAAGTTDSGLVNRIVARTLLADATITSNNHLRDSLFAILDTLQNLDVAGHVFADVQQILDSVLIWDNANENWDKLRDTLNALMALVPLVDVAVSTRLAPTVAGRTLDVATTGEAGVDFNNILGQLAGAEIALTQSEFTPDYAIAGDAMTLTAGERTAVAAAVNSALAQFLVDSLNQAIEASRLGAIHQGIVPSVYDSSWIVGYPGAWTPNKDSVKAYVFKGLTIDTLTMNRYRWGYWVVGSDSTAVADTTKVFKR